MKLTTTSTTTTKTRISLGTRSADEACRPSHGGGHDPVLIRKRITKLEAGASPASFMCAEHKRGATTLQQIANALNDRGVSTARGGSWYIRATCVTSWPEAKGDARCSAPDRAFIQGVPGVVWSRFWEMVKTKSLPRGIAHQIDQTVTPRSSAQFSSRFSLIVAPTIVCPIGLSPPSEHAGPPIKRRLGHYADRLRTTKGILMECGLTRQSL
jgi:hypothetical protein